MAAQRYRPEINARAYASSALLARLALLLTTRQADEQQASPGRYQETQAIAAELTYRAVASSLLTTAASLIPETRRDRINRTNLRPAARIPNSA